MELENIMTIHSSEKSEIILGESEGKQYIKKTGEVSHEAVQKIARINSPYIAKICEFGENYIITEYAEGFPLSERKIPAKKVFEVALELCDALAVLHEQNIIHRDVKPSNIILCNDGHIKLIDFDAARIKKTTTDKDTRFVGTDGFAPPEQYGFMQTDERSDIYSFGVTIKLLLAEDYARSPYKRVIERCIRFNPEQRYFSIKAVKSALKRSRIMPFFIGSIAGTAVLVAMILVLNFGINSQTPPDDMSRTESPFVQSTSSVSESSAPVYVSSSSSTNSFVASLPSSSLPDTSSPMSSISSSSSTSSSTLSLSSISSSVSSLNSTSSSTPSSSITSSNTSSLSSATSSEPELIIPPKDDKVYPVSWDALTLPEGFPRIKNGVEYFSFGDENNPKSSLRFFITWDILTEENIRYIAEVSRRWLGKNTKVTISIDKDYSKRWSMENSEYRIVVCSGTDDDPRTYFDIFPKAENYKFPELNLSLADKAVEGTKERPLDWDEVFLNNDIPKLANRLTKVDYNDNSYTIYWRYMDLAETESVVKKIIDSFGGEYTYVSFGEKGCKWDLDVIYGGRSMTANVSHNSNNTRYYQTIVTFTMQ